MITWKQLYNVAALITTADLLLCGWTIQVMRERRLRCSSVFNLKLHRMFRPDILHQVHAATLNISWQVHRQVSTGRILR